MGDGPKTAGGQLLETDSMHRECLPPGRLTSPLVVDMSPVHLTTLEAARRQGVILVRHDCEGLQVLESCRAPGDYGYLGLPPQTERAHLQGKEVVLNLPQLGTALTRGSKDRDGVSLQLLVAGRHATTTTVLGTPALEGDCAGATHFVRSIDVGAFALAEVHGEPQLDIDLFERVASDKSAGPVNRLDGNPDECKKGTVTDQQPPLACSTPLRLVLIELAAEARKRTPKPPRSERLTTPPRPFLVPCEHGQVRLGAKCTTEELAKGLPYRCRDREQCQTQCELASAESCSLLGYLKSRDEPESALAAYQKGCEGGDPNGCLGAAVLLAPKGKDDAAQALELLETACNGGQFFACEELGLAHLLAAKPDKQKAEVAIARACNAGLPSACSRLANHLALEKEPPFERMLGLYQRACHGPDPLACAQVASMYFHGKGVTASEEEAKGWFKVACSHGYEGGSYVDKVRFDCENERLLPCRCPPGDPLCECP